MRYAHWLYALGAGFVFALPLFVGVVACLHTDGFLCKYRSVLAVGCTTGPSSVTRKVDYAGSLSQGWLEP